MRQLLPRLGSCALVATLILSIAGSAVAVTKRGNSRANTIVGTAAADRLFDFGVGNDRIDRAAGTRAQLGAPR